MNRYEISYFNKNTGFNSSVVVFAENIVLAVYSFVDNRLGNKEDIISITKRGKAV